MIDFELLSLNEKKKIARILNRCQNCGKECIPGAHRINRGYAGGRYTLKNIDWLCKKCHDERHEMERMGKKG